MQRTQITLTLAARVMFLEGAAVVPDSLRDFFVASVGASAALIGLLFVAVSIAPERVFGPGAAGNAEAFAASAFIALGNIFFISLAGLLPFLNIGILVVVMGISGLINSLLLIVDVWRRGFKQSRRGLTLTLGSTAIYLFEILWGSALLNDPHQVGAVDNVTGVLLVAYAVALARAWELLGGTDYSLTRSVIALVRRRRKGTSASRRDTPSRGDEPPDGRGS